MRPLRSLLLLLIFLALFTGLHYVVPYGHLFPSVREFLPAADLQIPIAPVEKKTEQADSTDRFTEAAPDSTKLTSADTIPQADSLLLPARPDPLSVFLDSLRLSKGQVRIMYYGDSQIEGDRITSYLRQTLRKEKGGTGPGLFLPQMPVMYTRSYSVRSSSNWRRYNFLSYKAGEISFRDFGPFMAACRFLPEGEKSDLPVKAFVSVRPARSADSASSVYDRLRIFYGNAGDLINVVVRGDGAEKCNQYLEKGKGYKELSCLLGRPHTVQIEFTGQSSPDIYGISIEGDSGIVIDNIAQRGSAGLEFTIVGKKNLEQAYRMLSPDLFILQYGLNVVKNIVNDYSYYERGLARQINLLKDVSPATPVLVIGLTDMAMRDGDSTRSYPNVPVIIEAQKKAAEEAGAAFWNSFNAMGGQSSIVRWSEMEPALAQKDYVHFTFAGADTLSKMIVEDLFSEKQQIIPGEVRELNDSIPAGQKMVPEPDAGLKVSKNPILCRLLDLLKFNPGKPLIFTTPGFWLFMLFVLGGFSIFYRKLALRNAFLLLVSLFFYYKSGGLFLFLLVFVILVDFSTGILISRTGKRYKRRLFVLVSLLSNLGLLAYFKYTGFFIETINQLFGTHLIVNDYLASMSNLYLGTSFDVSSIILPVGISFFTFQSLSYVFDVYRKKIEPVRNFIDFGFYVSFFPQLVAGPIVRASEFIPQLYSEYHLAKREFSHAIFLISKGLIKKIIIADFIAVNFVDRVFDAPSIYSGFENLVAVYGYGLQIYCDFSGYTDIAIGLGLIFGFRLPLNFNSPYKAAGLSDFWKRWHISLSRWLKDYLYIPLGGNRKGKFRSNLNLMITMLLGGLWHGASIRFVIWGFLHGTGLVIARIWHSLTGKWLKPGKFQRALSVFITFQFVSFCWIFFRAPDMSSVGEMLKQIGENFSPGSYMTVIPAYGSVFLLIIAGYSIHFLPESVKESYRGYFIRMPLVAQLAIIMIFAVIFFQMKSADVMPFIYFRF